MMSESVKIVNGALDVIQSIDGDERLVLRGVINPKSLILIQVGTYQREILPATSVEEIEKALQSGSVPDVDLGMRGERCRNTTEFKEKDTFFLLDPVFVVDGLQRISAGKNLLAKPGVAEPRLGATIHFNTTEEWERERFRILNTDRVRLNANVLLRNLKHDLKGIAMLLSMCERDTSFVLKEKVSWQQRMPKSALVTAVTVLKSIGILHCHIGPTRSTQVSALASGFEKVFIRVGKNKLRANIRTFFDIVNECWGIASVTYKSGSPQLRVNFLMALAEVFAYHLDFWREETKLMVVADIRRKLAQFNVMDPHVKDLASSSGPARQILFQLIVDQINSGKRTRRLSPRKRREEVETEETGAPEIIDNGETNGIEETSDQEQE